MDQSEDDGTANPLEISLIVRNIFNNLSTKELLGVSLVNKLWDYEARCVLRDQRKCVAVIEEDSPCLRAKELNDMLGSLAVIPFNGLSIKIGSHKCGADLRQRVVEEVYENLEKMPLKYLEFEWSQNVKRNCFSEYCILGQFLLKTMATSLTLEHLEIHCMPMRVGLTDYIDPDEEQNRLPKLKTVQFPDDIFYSEDWAVNCLKVISNRAANLVELKNTVDLDTTAVLPLEKFRIFKHIELGSPLWIFDEDNWTRFFKLLEVGTELSTLCATGYSELDLKPPVVEEYWPAFCGILSTNSSSLRKVKLDNIATCVLGVCAILKKMLPLEGVKSLEFEVRNQMRMAYLLHERFSTIFPGITSVSFDYENPWLKVTPKENPEEPVHPWPAVTELKLENCILRAGTTRDLRILFPNLQSIQVFLASKMSVDRVQFRHIWSSFQSLERLATSSKLEINAGSNFDAEFCGIHREEAALLQQKDETYLKNVCIVPPFPPVNYLKVLKAIEMEVSYSNRVRKIPTKKLFLSKVTGHIAFRQMPDLALHFRTDGHTANHLKHLKPFVRVVFDY